MPEAKPGLTLELSGWLETSVFRNFGGVGPVSDLPQFAVKARDTFGISVRQSRVRAVVGLPADGLLGGATLAGLIEADFMGTPVGDDASLPTAQLRHAWVSATWKAFGNLTLTAGQTWGLLEGPHFATSLGHLAVPRFEGAGFLFRRAPQVRLGVEGSGAVALSAQVAALAPIDRTRSAGVYVGERSGLPDVEARVAAAWRRGGVSLAEFGLSGRYGELVYLLEGRAGKPDETVHSWGAAADARVRLPWVTLQGAAFVGQSLGVYGSIAPEVKTTATLDGLTAVSSVRTRGLWAQAVVTPFPPLELLLGYGIEDPEVADLPATPAATTINRNQQTSGGVVLALGSRWKVSGEVTWYLTNTQDRFLRNATQFELVSLCSF